MFFYLSKIFYYFIVPINWISLFFLLYFIFRKKKASKRLLYIAISLLFIFTNPFIFNVIVKSWEGPPQPITILDKSYNYIILLGGFSDYKKKIDPQYLVSERGNRLVATLQLYHNGNAPKILVSGGSSNIWENIPSEAERVKDFLVLLGISPEDIITETSSRNTYENALFTKRILEQKNNKAKCILVTSAFHMKRAQGLFENLGIDVTPYPTDYFAEGLNNPNHIIIPNAKVLWKWETLIKEWFGILVYKIKGDL